MVQTGDAMKYSRHKPMQKTLSLKKLLEKCSLETPRRQSTQWKEWVGILAKYIHLGQMGGVQQKIGNSRNKHRLRRWASVCLYPTIIYHLLCLQTKLDRSAISYSLVILSLSCLTSVKTGLKARVNLGEVRISRERSIDANLAAAYKHYRHGGLTVYSIISPAQGISHTNIQHIWPVS